MLPTPCAISGRFNHLRVNNEVVEQVVIVFETYITWKITRKYVIFHVLHVKLWGPLIRIATVKHECRAYPTNHPQGRCLLDRYDTRTDIELKRLPKK